MLLFPLSLFPVFQTAYLDDLPNELPSEIESQSEISPVTIPSNETGVNALCDPDASPKVGVTQVRFSVGFNWLTRPQNRIFSALEQYATQAVAYTDASPWPTIHEAAKLARVPVMMYHDVLPEKEVFFDVTTEELEQDFQLIRDHDLTPISLDQLVAHLQTGMALPEKPILLTFDDGYVGHYDRVFPLIKKYGYPALFSVFTAKVDGKVAGRSTLTWSQLAEMAANPLVTIASHSVTHPPDLTQLPDSQLLREVIEAKRILEARLGKPIQYFTYPEGHYDARVAEAVTKAGYRAALTMDDFNEQFAEQSESLLAIARFGQSRLEDVIDQAWGGISRVPWWKGFNFQAPIAQQTLEIDSVPLILISGGKPITIHANSRYQVAEILEGSGAIAGVDGGFFSLEFLDSNQMVGPVLSQSSGEFVAGNPGENPLLNGRPLILISSNAVKFVPFQATQHNTLAGIQAEMPDVTDAFVGAAWLVKDNTPQPPENFGNLFDFDAARDRAFWGINQAGQPVIGVSRLPVDSVTLGEVLAKAGMRDAVMLDSGASASLAYEGQSLMDYIPRPVPHVVGLVPTAATPLHNANPCALVQEQLSPQAQDPVPDSWIGSTPDSTQFSPKKVW
jgi:peptidoglycan/xylan/chitin deacetylase (PgdA/CDA1 family)